MNPLSHNARLLLEARYLRRAFNGKPSMETPEEMFQRVAQTVAQAELSYGEARDLNHWHDEFYVAMSQLNFLPNSPTLMNAGHPSGQLSACFVLPVEDHLEGILDTLKLASMIQQSGGGTGFDFSSVRPKNDRLETSGGVASGPVSFIRMFNEATEQIKQGGKRRGANMAVLRVDHPDIEEFIQAKISEGELRNFNLSVGITDAFVKAIIEGADWPLINPRNKEVVKTIPARKLEELMTHCAWQTGDPGILFLDRIESFNPTPRLGKLEGTNPCGEMPLLPFESCNLGSVNLSLMVSTKNKTPSVDWDKLSDTVMLGIRFLDNVVDVNHWPDVQLEKITKGNRKIGLGVMGWAEMLFRLGIPYESKEAIELAGQVMSFIRKRSLIASSQLAEKRGCFPNWDFSVYAGTSPMRNATLTSIAPTGSISIIAGTSSSIEPLFALAYSRMNSLEGQNMFEFNPYFLEALNSLKLNTPEILEEVKASGSVQHLNALPLPFRNLFKTALEIPYTYHIRHQAMFQHYTDNAVSKTINLPYHATEAMVRNAAHLAWSAGTKGLTIYRDGCKAQQVLNAGISTRKPSVCRVCA